MINHEEKVELYEIRTPSSGSTRLMLIHNNWFSEGKFSLHEICFFKKYFIVFFTFLWIISSISSHIFVQGIILTLSPHFFVFYQLFLGSFDIYCSKARKFHFVCCHIQSTIDSEGFKGGTRGAPIMPRDAVSRTANVERTARH